ncbi:MAG: dihydropteroate synthase [Nitrospira sp.]|nr:dihydropteroate synthase [Nitrospira sp.]
MIVHTQKPADTFTLAHGRRLALDRPLVMGILNVTPDSFSDGGRYLDSHAALERATTMVGEGADLIDIGAESSRPGALPVPAAEELRRLIPIVRAVCRQVAVPVSVDTTKAVVAEQAIGQGATIINDISALEADPAMVAVVARTGAGLVLMHRQGTSPTMQVKPQYGDVVGEVRAYLQTRMEMASRAGIAEDHIVLDPGIGFGKNREHNLALLTRLEELLVLGRPLLLGVSRKAFIGEVLGRQTDERIWGTAAAVAVAVLRGARIVRVHDVTAMRDVVRMVHAIHEAR